MFGIGNRTCQGHLYWPLPQVESEQSGMGCNVRGALHILLIPMNNLPGDIILDKRFHPCLFATCSQYRNLIPSSTRRALAGLMDNSWPGSRFEPWHKNVSRRASICVSRAFRSGCIEAAIWILQFGVGIDGPHLNVAPSHLHAWLLSIGCKEWPKVMSVACFGPVSVPYTWDPVRSQLIWNCQLVLVMNVCEFTHLAEIQVNGSPRSSWVRIDTLQVIFSDLD